MRHKEGTRDTRLNRSNADRHIMLGVLRVKSHASCALDGNPSCKRVLSLEQAMKASGENISNFRFGLNNVF